MKKLLLILSCIFILFLVFVYVFIPSKITFSKVSIINKKNSIVSRLLLNESYWQKWWPSANADRTTAETKKYFFYKKNIYVLEKTMMNAGQISISGPQYSLHSLITVISVNDDSAAISWKSEMPVSHNPFIRIKNYIEARNLKNNMASILQSFQIFLKETENVYGLAIDQIQVKDTLLISTKFNTQQYPSTTEIYAAINKLKKYVANEGATETNSPMLNILPDSTEYRTMVAIPIDKNIPEKNDYKIKRMVPGKILVTEVKGGEAIAKEALKQLNFFIIDNQISSPAIPFESLVTDRSVEKDTSKWITKIYYPVF